MMRFVRGLLLASICIAGAPVRGEEIWYPGQQRPILAISKKIQRSMNNARYVAEGSFTEIAPVHSLVALDETRGMLSVTFNIKRLLKERDLPLESAIQINLVTYRPLSASNTSADSAALAMSREIEHAVSGRTVAFDEYLNALNKARMPLLKSSDYLKRFFIVPVTVGSLDTAYRVADAVVQLHKTYLIFVIRDRSSTGDFTLFSGDCHDLEDRI